MTGSAINWRPQASLQTLQARARMLKCIRAFFDARQVLEVETPVLYETGAMDPHIDSMSTHWSEHRPPVYLQTSPEYAMKRLLAAGSGPIYQVSHVFRFGERGRQHHPEFSMLEWYRPGLDHHQLMDEVEALVQEVLNQSIQLRPTLRWTYRQAWQMMLSVDPFVINSADLQVLAKQRGLDTENIGEDKDIWLQLLMSHVVEPALPKNTPVFIYDFPASQAALARIRYDDIPVAERFELYVNGMELANGFHELNHAAEQRRRFDDDNTSRKSMGKPNMQIDEKLLAALPELPDCAGVALGLDRLLMLATNSQTIDEVLAFTLNEN